MRGSELVYHRVQSLFSARSNLNNCIYVVAESSSIYTTRKESLQKEPLELIIFCLQAACLDAVWLYPKLRKSFRYFDYCREDFPYSANKPEDPRSQKRTDKTEVAELIRLERSFSSLVEELTSKGNLHNFQRDLQRNKQVKQEKVGIMKRFSLRIAEFKRKKNEEKREDDEKDKEDNKKPQDAEIIIISSDSEAEENEDDADYVEFLASYVPEEEQEEEEEAQNPDPIEISSEDAEEKSEISSEYYPSD
ncbi:unnamed protein product [Trifolium pratense]|uniref:Uncharacterized protein n=1 Tax=Trifolium pratense TaxID=57577 RepID=A0ACB0K4Y8_TRIPR|nr:unnamed protein product [Trifolium pratense]